MSESPTVDDTFGPYWTRKLILRLIELYRKNGLLWEIKHENYNNKHKKIEAWQNIAAELDLPLPAIRRKLLSILGCYRRYKSRYRRKIAEGFPRQQVFPKWYGYNLLRFLDSNRQQMPESIADVNKPSTSKSPDKNTKQMNSKRRILIKKQKPKGRRVKPQSSTSSDDETERDNINITNEEVVTKIMEDVNICDPYYTYGLYIANELRKYNKLTLAKVKHAINKIIFEADVKQITEHGNNDRGDARQSKERVDPLQEYEIDYAELSDFDDSPVILKSEVNFE